MPLTEPGAPDWLTEQIAAYRKEEPAYRAYKEVLLRVLGAACIHSLPEALVQARVKTFSSFAEKCVRKSAVDKQEYSDPVHRFTDLCGARLVVQTLEQVLAVRQFIETQFEIVEADNKEAKLDRDRFGYRDMHYIVKLRATDDLEIDGKERETIGARKAEIQVRTWVQHAWADTLHDRMYKAALRPSAEILRTGALLAATMENGDREFDRLAAEIDGMAANYTAFATREEVTREIGIRETLLEAETETFRRMQLALHLAQLVAGATGDFARVVELLNHYRSEEGSLRAELLMELGYALCRLEDGNGNSSGFKDGQARLRESVDLQEHAKMTAIPDLRRARSLLARTHARLGWSWERVSGRESEALACYHRALALEPDNPYYLADILGFEVFCARSPELPASTRIAVKKAIAVCREHVLAGIEMPVACFTAGRLNLLLAVSEEDGTDAAYSALAWYARGLRHCGHPDACVPDPSFTGEFAHLDRLHFGKPEPPPLTWVRNLLTLALAAREGSEAIGMLQVLTSSGPPSLASPVVIVAGGAASLPSEREDRIRESLTGALEDFRGTLVAGGTTSGVPGLAGEVAEASKPRDFRLIGYIPRKLPLDAQKDVRYDQCIVCRDESFSPEQILTSWSDILAAGIAPSAVRVLGFGGGKLSALEYRIALALGASVGVVTRVHAADSRLIQEPPCANAADGIVADPLWSTDVALLPLPDDESTIHAFVAPRPSELSEEQVERMARVFHERYLANSGSRFPENLRPWETLGEGYREANREQARHMIEILQSAGFEVCSTDSAEAGGAIKEIPDGEPALDRMAELEHGRWNVDRLRDGWRPGPSRDNTRKIHDKILAWVDVDPTTRRYDYQAVQAFPEILALAGLEIQRPNSKPKPKTESND
jgi:ppGpp synthetase/RelA/SpoT-type nucleotidyltranferase